MKQAYNLSGGYYYNKLKEHEKSLHLLIQKTLELHSKEMIGDVLNDIRKKVTAQFITAENTESNVDII